MKKWIKKIMFILNPFGVIKIWEVMASIVTTAIFGSFLFKSIEEMVGAKNTVWGNVEIIIMTTTTLLGILGLFYYHKNKDKDTKCVAESLLVFTFYTLIYNYFWCLLFICFPMLKEGITNPTDFMNATMMDKCGMVSSVIVSATYFLMREPNNQEKSNRKEGSVWKEKEIFQTISDEMKEILNEFQLIELLDIKTTNEMHQHEVEKAKNKICESFEIYQRISTENKEKALVELKEIVRSYAELLKEIKQEEDRIQLKELEKNKRIAKAEEKVKINV